MIESKGHELHYHCPMPSFDTPLRYALSCSILLAALAVPAHAQATADPDTTYQPQVGQPGKDVVWVPTPDALLDRMLDLAELTPDDYLIDLGSGDGRTVIAAARRGARAHGIEYDPRLVALSQRSAQSEGLAERATFEQADIFKSDFSHATVITLFLLPRLNLRLRPTLLNMQPGTRIVSNSFDLGDWKPDEQVRLRDNCEQYCNTYKWTVPAKVQGWWSLDGQELVLRQRFQMIEGTLRQGGGPRTPIREARLHGSRIEFRVGSHRYVGEVDGDAMRGQMDGAREWRAVRTK